MCLALPLSMPAFGESWIRINQLGYLPQSVKTAVFISEEKTDVGEFELVEALTMRPVAKFQTVANTGKYGTMESTCRLNFTSFEQQGSYCLKVGDTYSPAFRIGTESARPPSSMGTPSTFTIWEMTGRLEEARQICISRCRSEVSDR